MESLKLGVLGLSEPEQSLVATLFRLHRVDPSFIWTLTDTAPFDALLVDVGVPSRSYVQLVDQRTKIKRLGAPGQANPGEMPRPIRSDLLVGWLSSIEAGLLQEVRQAAQAGAPAAGQPMTPSAQPAQPVLKASDKLNALLATPQPNDNTLFRLKRWPPTGVLSRDVGRIRMATLLSRKAMSLAELTMLSRMPDAACLGFLRELDTQGLLTSSERIAQAPLAAGRAAHAGAPNPATRARPSVASSLIHSIRRRFGIG
jgi:hypothetical protein